MLTDCFIRAKRVSWIFVTVSLFSYLRAICAICRTAPLFTVLRTDMPIHAGKEQHAPDDERVALLSADEENQNGESYKGNGLPGADNVKGSTKYGATWQRAIKSAMRSKHRYEISRKLKEFKLEDFEKHRRSDDEIKEIKDKKVRKYYEEQNRRLNDWLEGELIA